MIEQRLSDDEYRRIMASAKRINRERSASVVCSLHGFPTPREFVKYIHAYGFENILDLGAGTGRFSTELDQIHRGLQVFNLDLSPEKSNPNKLIVADFTHLPFANDSFDLAMSTYALACYARDKEDVCRGVSEAIRVIRPYGQLMFTLYDGGYFHGASSSHRYADDSLFNLSMYLDLVFYARTPDLKRYNQFRLRDVVPSAAELINFFKTDDRGVYSCTIRKREENE